MMTLKNKAAMHSKCWLGVCAAGILQLLLANQSLAYDDPFEFTYYVDARYRIEQVDQGNFEQDAKASTLRTNLGGRAALPLLEDSSLAFFTELQDVSVIGRDDYDSTTNNKVTRYPIIADPEGTEFNQAALAWTMGKSAKVIVGRQKINLGNQRFIGSVGWRQNDQTFDSLLATYKTQRGDELVLGYLAHVNRINGNQHPLGDLDSESYLLNAVMGFSSIKLNPYVYSLSFDDRPAGSTQTLGANVSGQVNIGVSSQFNYSGELAQQIDYANNPGDFSVSYLATEVGMQYPALSWGVGFEILEGTGSAAFQTPLATLHKFNGWADKFLTTPPRGLADSYFKVGNLDWLTLKWSFEYHQYATADAEVSQEYGQELGVQATRKLNNHFDLLFKYANYQESGFDSDTRKIWLALGIRFE